MTHSTLAAESRFLREELLLTVAYLERKSFARSDIAAAMIGTGVAIAIDGKGPAEVNAYLDSIRQSAAERPS